MEQENKLEVQAIKEVEPNPVLAVQHIYTRVPIRQSPSALEGWQIYRYTRTGESALSLNDVRYIEAFLEHQRSFTGRGRRWQFFPLDEQRIVFTRVVPRSEFDRGGNELLHLDHSLIVPVSEIKRLPDGLLSLWDDNLYVNELEELPPAKDSLIPIDLVPKKLKAAERGNREVNEDIIPAELARLARDLPGDKLIETLEAKNAQPLADLIRLMINAKELVKNHYKVYLCGTRSTKGEIAQVLKLAIRMAELMPDADETSLSFTTWIPDDGGSIAPFWAVGVSHLPSYRWTYGTPTLFARRVLGSIRLIDQQPVKELTPEEIHQQQLSHQSVMNALDKIRQKEVEMAKPQEVPPPQATKNRGSLLDKMRIFLRGTKGR